MEVSLFNRHGRPTRRFGFEASTHRSISLDHYTSHDRSYLCPPRGCSEAGDDDSDDELVERSPLPCEEGCPDFVRLSTNVFSVALDQSLSLGPPGGGGGGDDDVMSPLYVSRNLETEEEDNEEKESQSGAELESHLMPDIPVSKELNKKPPAAVDSRQAAIAQRKSVKELYGKPSWWGDDNDVEEKVASPSSSKIPSPQRSSFEPNISSTKTSTSKVTIAVRNSGQAFTIDFNATTRKQEIEPVPPRRAAQAFTVDLDEVSSCLTSEDGAGRMGEGGSLSQYIPPRLRKAISEREEVQQQKKREKAINSISADATPAVKKKQLRAGGVGSAAVTAPRCIPPRQMTGLRPQTAATPFPTRGRAVGARKAYPGAARGFSHSAAVTPRTSLDRPSTNPPFTLAQRSPLRRAATTSGAVTSAPKATPVRRFASTREPSGGSSVNSQSPVLSPLTQRNRIPLRSSEVTLTSSRVGAVPSRPVAVSNRNRLKGRAMTETTQRIPPGDKKRGNSKPGRNYSTRPTESSSDRDRNSINKPSRLLSNSAKKPLTTQPQAPLRTTLTISDPKPSPNQEDYVLASLSAAVWSYHDPKNYLMDQMFKGISLNYQCSTTNVFNEFNQAATKSDSPEEREELELFQQAEVEADLCEQVSDDASPISRAAAALSPVNENFGKTFIRGTILSQSYDLKSPSNLPLLSAAASTVNLTNPLTKPSDHDDQETYILRNAASTVQLDNHQATKRSGHDQEQHILGASTATFVIDNPQTKPSDHSLVGAASMDSLVALSVAGTYVMDVNDTMAADGVPPVIITDDYNPPMSKVMETSNTCTLPNTITPKSGSPCSSQELGEASAMKLFEEIILRCDASKEEASPDLEIDLKTSGTFMGSNRCEVFKKNPAPSQPYGKSCWNEKSVEIEMKKSHGKSTWNGSKRGLKPKYVGSNDSGRVNTMSDEQQQEQQEPIVKFPPLENGSKFIQQPFQFIPPPPPYAGGRIFPADVDPEYPSAFEFLPLEASSSSSSSPLIDQLKCDFFQSISKPQEFSKRQSRNTSEPCIDQVGVSNPHEPIKSAFTPYYQLDDRQKKTRYPSRASVHAFRNSWDQHDYECEEGLSLRRRASKLSIHSEMAMVPFRERWRNEVCSPDGSVSTRRVQVARTFENDERKHTEKHQQKKTFLKSTLSTASLDTALLLRDSQEALNDIARRIYRQPAQATLSTTPLQLPQFPAGCCGPQTSVASNICQAGDSRIGAFTSVRDHNNFLDRIPYADDTTLPTEPPCNYISNSVEYMNGLERLMSLSKPSMCISNVQPAISRRFTASAVTPDAFKQPRRMVMIASGVGGGGTGLGRGPASDSMIPYSPPASSLSPTSVVSANEIGGQSLRGSNRKHTVTNMSNRYSLHRHSLRSANQPRADSPTADDLTNQGPPFTSSLLLLKRTEASSAKLPNATKGNSTITALISPTNPLLLQHRLDNADTVRGNGATAGNVKHSAVNSTPSDVPQTRAHSRPNSIILDELSGLQKPLAKRLDPDDIDLPNSRLALLRPTDINIVSNGERARRSFSFGSFNEDEKLAEDVIGKSNEESYETLLASSILRLSNRLRRCSDNLALRIGVPSNETPPTMARAEGLKASTSLHQELHDSLANMQSVEQQLQYVEHLLFPAKTSSASTADTDYLQELERINKEIRGFVPIDANTVSSKNSSRLSEATDSGIISLSANCPTQNHTSPRTITTTMHSMPSSHQYVLRSPESTLSETSNCNNVQNPKKDTFSSGEYY